MSIVRLGDICQFINGGAWTQSEFSDSGYPVLKVSNCKPSGFVIDDVSYIPLDIAEKSEMNKLHIHDVIIATVGSHPNLVDSAAGRSCIVTDEVTGYYLNQNAVCLRTLDDNILNQRYLGFLTQYFPFQHYIQSRGKGAANQMRIAISAIKDYTFELPEITIQNRVANILSAYDDLIENNQKQIKLLEEAAQRLYKEWFVDLRFPGYENTPVVDGVPEGWKNGILGEIANFKRGKTITKDQTCEGNIPVVAGGLEPAYYHNQANAASPVITVSGSGANAGFTRMYHTKIWASDCSFVDSQSTSNIYFAYCVLKNKKSDIDALQKGAAQPHVYAKDINALEILVPNGNLLVNFENTVAPLFKKIKGLYRQIELSKQARDRLLPKIMSDELEVC